MIIEPVINGVVARTAHPQGCQQAVLNQINYSKKHQQIEHGPKRVLILGASSGFGLAARVALTFGGAQADTIGVSFERGPSEKGVGTAGWYNNIYFREQAEAEGRIAHNIVGDAFSAQVKEEVIELINRDFGGQIDLVVYSLATGLRPDPKTGETWRSCLKTVGKPFSGKTVNLEKNCLDTTVLEVANEQEILATEKVMGGEDWEEWIRWLRQNNALATGAKTVAFSYIGPEMTYPIYHDGTLGLAKKHLQKTADRLHDLLSADQGEAYVSVCKALVTKASVFIPAFSPYVLCLYQVMKQMGLHETCIEQMQRLFSQKLYLPAGVPVDAARLIRVDDWELRPDVQQAVNKLMTTLTDDNFAEVGDYAGYKKEFLQLNGFAFDNVDYQKDVDLSALIKLKP
ncbi:TPA: trans-2-enoyl-CoA reductase family protein [Klebsiella pneumoniae]|uniref:enoyl-ACP reductase FabV n=1 Tax=Klebsiella pneumoniae TaxID=573 RepID=UPI001CF16348|nr:enoyl-ACP reductase FabV [Klebsiella pneumoniae]MCB3583510.1 trans-2-enoyl-CoA reductase family protein [Klebsiella pneumoniae]MCB3611116.1 trans-2-enoyl-CoA reductase family protein [Klebsiella pneumoniae]MCG5606594.1 trans-2-enoyl-CoA reductase family protein [Klebsiella pneumoniae]HBT4640567.1 trans-2-enoyl-CoA reductase family protein [Klebsiella pneumoniae]HBW7904774.1 trans-2-enoyl-CoA reductase family protein [Klebsiella pneumoniae]